MIYEWKTHTCWLDDKVYTTYSMDTDCGVTIRVEDDKTEKWQWNIEGRISTLKYETAYEAKSSALYVFTKDLRKTIMALDNLEGA